MIEVEASRSALSELRHARRHNHRDAVHWIDALYRAYMAGLIAIITVVVGSSLFGETKISAAGSEQFAHTAIPWLGLTFALALAVGMRSGARGGPLTLEAPTIHYELMAPMPYTLTLREPAIKQLRFMAFTGACVGACVAALGVRQLHGNPVVLVAGSALAFSLVATLAVSLAMIFSGRRVGIIVANACALLLLAWSAADIVLNTTTSPATMLATIAFTGVMANPLGVIPLLLTIAAVPVAILGLGGTSIDDARRRAGLVTQLRFAVTLQDIRTVVLLRRQLAQETPRANPWFNLKRGGRMPPIWRRDWRAYFRFPTSRVVRLVFFAVVAGLALGVTWRGVKPAFLISAIALYLAAYDAVEPLAQEIDHPSRWDDIPDDHGKVLLMHLPAAFIVMVVVCLIAAASALILVPANVVLAVLPLLIVPVAASAMGGAAMSTAMGSPNVAKMMGGAGAEFMGFLLLLRLVFPPALTAAALAPIFTIGSDPHAIDTTQASSLVSYVIAAPFIALIYVRYQKPTRV